MAEMVTDTRLEIRLCPLNIDDMTDDELDSWLKQNRGTRTNIPVKRSAATSTLRIPKEKKPAKKKIIDAADFF